MKLAHLAAAGIAAAAVIPAVAFCQAAYSAGKYQISTTIESVEMPGAPAAVTQMMAGKTNSVTICITPEQASKGYTGAQPAKDCTAGKVSVAGGKISTSMTCTMPTGTMTVNDTGSYTSDSFDITGKVSMTGRQTMSQTVRIVGKRLGAC